MSRVLLDHAPSFTSEVMTVDDVGIKPETSFLAASIAVLTHITTSS